MQTIKVFIVQFLFLEFFLLGLSLGFSLVGLPPTMPFTVRDAHAAEVQHIYEDAGRLKATIGETETAIFSYDEVGNLKEITRQSAAQLAIIDFSPKCGLPDSHVTVAGSGFGGSMTVTFNGVAAGIMSANANQIVVQVPGGPSSGLIQVTSSGGSTTSSQPFTVGPCTGSGIGAPTITGFAPQIGTAGTAVTVTGTNFDPNPINAKVTFNSAYATTTAATTTSMTTTVPYTATSGHIAVATPAGKGVSTGMFFVPPAPYTTADVQVMDSLGFSTSKTVTLSSANKIALVAFDGAAGWRVSLKVDPVTFPNGVVVSINKPDGTVLAFAYNYFIDTVVLPTTGTYTIMVDPPGTDTGQATVVLYSVPPDVPGTLTLNAAAVSVSIPIPGQNAVLTFTGTAGQKATVKITNNTLQAPIDNRKVTVTLTNASGTVLTSKTSNSGSFNLAQQTLLTAGTYTVFIDPQLANSGSLKVQVTNP